LVLIGKDLILGLGNSSLLSHELLSTLKKKNITYLYQASGSSRPGTICSEWKDSGDLALTRILAKEWDLYCRDLSGSGIHLQDIDDELKWIGGDKSGALSSKMSIMPLLLKFGSNPFAVGGKICGLGI
jgi:hypothetical protein